MLDFLARDYPIIHGVNEHWTDANFVYLVYTCITKMKTKVLMESWPKLTLKITDHKLLGYRAVKNKIRQEHGLFVTRDQMYAVIKEVDPEGLEARGERKNVKRAILPVKVRIGSTLLMAKVLERIS